MRADGPTRTGLFGVALRCSVPMSYVRASRPLTAAAPAGRSPAPPPLAPLAALGLPGPYLSYCPLRHSTTSDASEVALEYTGWIRTSVLRPRKAVLGSAELRAYAVKQSLRQELNPHLGRTKGACLPLTLRRHELHGDGGNRTHALLGASERRSQSASPG